jgi:hypothetical protein
MLRTYSTQVYEEMCKEARAPLVEDYDLLREQFHRHYQFAKFLPDENYIAILTHHWITRLSTPPTDGTTFVSEIWGILKDADEELTLQSIHDTFNDY